MHAHLSSSLGAFRLLCKDYGTLLEYIDPVVENSSTYSLRTYELLLRACTEFESLAKYGATVHLRNGSLSGQTHIGELSKLYELLELEGTDVGVLSWRPEFFIAPLKEWEQRPKHGLKWYRAYNEVKHNRAECFRHASLENVTYSLAACMQLLQRLGGLSLRAALPSSDQDLYRTEWHFNGIPFTIRAPCNWPPVLRGEAGPLLAGA